MRWEAINQVLDELLNYKLLTLVQVSSLGLFGIVEHGKPKINQDFTEELEIWILRYQGDSFRNPYFIFLHFWSLIISIWNYI
jgi:hypothetical protein